MHKLVSAIAVLLVAIPVGAQESPVNLSAGKWAGDWESIRGGSGSMEMVVDVKGHEVFGQVRATGSRGCSVEWERLAGAAKGNKVFAHYNLGGPCGKVEIIYSIDQGGKIMSGSWSSQWPSNGTFRLSKQPTLPATGATGVNQTPSEQKR